MGHTILGKAIVYVKDSMGEGSIDSDLDGELTNGIRAVTSAQFLVLSADMWEATQ
jgi:hypothetical protein